MAELRSFRQNFKAPTSRRTRRECRRQTAWTRYLAMLLRSPDAQAYFKRVARGVAVKGVNIGDLKALKVPVAPLSAQRRIVAAIDEYLSRLDAASAALIVALARVEVLRAAAIRETFASHDWPWTTLGEVAELKGGVTKDAKRQTDPSYVEVPYLRVANVQRGYLDLENVTTIRVPPERAKALELQPGDVLFNEGGDRDKLGRGWIWEGQVPQCIHQNHVFRARLHRDDFDPRFLSTHGNTWGQRWFEEHGKQTTNLASINLATLKRFPVPAPPVAEQRKLMDQLELLEDKVRAIESAIEVAQRRSASLRRAVLDAAFSGRLVAHEAAEKPAPTLELKREPRPTNACKTTVQS